MGCSWYQTNIEYRPNRFKLTSCDQCVVSVQYGSYLVKSKKISSNRFRNLMNYSTANEWRNLYLSTLYRWKIFRVFLTATLPQEEQLICNHKLQATIIHLLLFSFSSRFNNNSMALVIDDVYCILICNQKLSIFLRTATLDILVSFIQCI